MSSRSRLRYSVEGASALANAIAVLASSDAPTGLYDENLTRKSLEAMFREIGASEEVGGCELILVLSGHGDQSTDQTWFCTYEANPDQIDLTGAGLADLVMLARPAKVSAVFDFCHAGGVAKDFRAALSGRLGDDNILVLSGATSQQLAYEHPALGRGLFTIALHEALVDKRLFALAAMPGTATQPSPGGSASSDLARLFVFARERTEQLAYLFAGGRRQSPELCGSGHLALEWSDKTIGPPLAPEPRRALAGRVRRVFGWSAALVVAICMLLYFLQYHIAVQPNGWIEVRPGPPWMSSLLPSAMGSGVQLAIAADDLEPASPRWDEQRIKARTALMRGGVGGLVSHPIGDQENWEFRLSSELSKDAGRRLHFVSSRSGVIDVCDSKDVKRDRLWDYQFALEAALLDRARSCPATYFLLNGPEIDDLYNVDDVRTVADYGLSELSDQAVRTYLAGLALAFGELRDEDARRRSLEAAILLTSVRAERDVVRPSDWLAFLRFVEDVAGSPKLTLAPNAAVFPRLARCAASWCELSTKIVEYFAAGPQASGMGNGAGMMMWLMAKDSERQAAEGSATSSWSLPPILLLARRGELNGRDLDLIIRRYGLLVINHDMFWVDPTWLPRFARVLPLSEEWSTPLWGCVLGTSGKNSSCLPIDASLAARVLAAQGRFLSAEALAQLVLRLDNGIKQDRDVAAYASEMVDLACWTPMPDRWVSGLEKGVEYDIQIAPPRSADPLTGVQIVEVTDVSVAQALSAALRSDHGSSPATINLLVRYASNHFSYAGLDVLYRALAHKLRPTGDPSGFDLVRSLQDFAPDAQARAVLLRALSITRPRSLLTDARIADGSVFWRLDAVLAARRQLGDYQFEEDQYCE